MRKLNDICNVITCGVAKRPEYYDDGIPFLSSKNVKSDRFLLNDYKYVSKEDFLSLTKNNKPEKGDILYTRVGSFGEAAVIDFDFDFAIFVSLTLIKPKNDIVLSRYLMHYLNSPKIKHLAKNSTSGVGVQNLNVKVVREFPIPLPPLEQQKKIAAILDAAAAFKQKTKALIEKYDELTQSLFLEMFGDETGSLTELGKVIKTVGGGTPSKDNEQYWNGSIPWASVKDLKSDRLNKTQDFITQSAVDNSTTRVIPNGSLIVATRMAVGRAAICEMDVAINQDLKAIQTIGEINIKYLQYLFKSKKNYFDSVSSGATVKGIKIEHITKLKVNLPSYSKQNQFGERVKAIEAQKTQAQASLAQAEDLFNSLLQKAFKGALV